MSAAANATPAMATAAARELHRRLRVRKLRDHVIESLLLLAAFVAVFTTAAIVYILVTESLPFFEHVALRDFLTDHMWTPMFANPRFGIMPLVAGTLVTTLVALALAIPCGTIIAIYLSEFAPHKVREIVKPALELLGAVPTVVYGYFALLVVTPFLQKLIPSLPGFNMLSPGLVIGIMIIPYVASVSEDAMRAVPNYMREGSYAMGATRFQTITRVLLPPLLPAVLTGFALAFARAVGEYGSVIFIAGNMPFVSEITPLLIVTKLEQYDYAGATAIAVVMLLISFALILTINLLQRWQSRRGR